MRAPVLVLLLATATLAGCLSASKAPAPKVDLGVAPILQFLPEVAIDDAHRGGEPSIVTDSKNNYYVSAPSGLVSTTFNTVVDPTLLPSQGPLNRESFIWKSADEGKTWTLLTVTPPPAPPMRGDAAPGGADTDLSVDACDTIYFTDLWAGDISVSHSTDGGKTWTGTPVTGRPSADRNWIAADPRPGHCGTLWLEFQNLVDPVNQLWVLKSTDYGMTFTQQALVIDCPNKTGADDPSLTGSEGCHNTNGPIVFDRSSGDLYFVTGLPDAKGVWVFRSADGGNAWTKTAIPMPNVVGNVFPVMDVDAAGNLYVVVSYHDGGSYNVYLTTSRDHGATWSPVESVSGDVAKGTEMFPWVAAGDAGRVAIVWYGVNDTVEKTDDAKGDWFAFLTGTEDAFAAHPVWSTGKLSAKPMHHGPICTLGLTCTLPKPVGTRGNRNLADFFEVGVDRKGAAIAAWANDIGHEQDFTCRPWFGKTTAGLSLLAPKQG